MWAEDDIPLQYITCSSFSIMISSKMGIKKTHMECCSVQHVSADRDSSSWPGTIYTNRLTKAPASKPCFPMLLSLFGVCCCLFIRASFSSFPSHWIRLWPRAWTQPSLIWVMVIPAGHRCLQERDTFVHTLLHIQWYFNSKTCLSLWCLYPSNVLSLKLFLAPNNANSHWFQSY